MVNKNITPGYTLAAIAAVLFTWIIHEFAHWLTSELLGYDTIMQLNGTRPVRGENPGAWHRVAISAAGPVITVLQAIVVFLVLKSQGWQKNLYPVLFTAFYMRTLAGLMNFINPNDEGRIGAFFEIGIFTLPVIVGAYLFYLVQNISNTYKLDWKFQLLTTIIVMIASSVLILSDQFLKIRLL